MVAVWYWMPPRSVFESLLMHPIHDSDVLLLLATTLSAKRKPAQLGEIIAAIELLHGAIPAESKLGDAFYRLATHGLIVAEGDSFTLTPDAQKIMATQPKRGAMGEHILSLKEKLAGYHPVSDAHEAILLSPEQIATAIRAHITAQRVAAQGAAKNLLMPVKSKETDNKRAGPNRRPSPRPRPKP